MSQRVFAWWVAAVLAVIGISRVAILKHPQPGTMKWWLFAAVVVFIVSWFLSNEEPEPRDEYD